MRQRPEITNGKTRKINTGCGHLYVTVNRDNEGVCEVFSQMGKAGGCAASQIQAISRLIALCLRSGIEIEDVLKQISGIRCPQPAWYEGKLILSCADGIGVVLAGEAGLTIRQINPPSAEGAGDCPECGETVITESGCLTCKHCGWSKCG
jgi:ribonucleoside-diphosphate reductase alpha chain